MLPKQLNPLTVTAIPITDAKAMTLTQLQTAIVPTKRDALISINGSDKISAASIRTYAKDGQITSQTDVDRDVETDAVVSGRQITWTYYPEGCVDTITIIETDAAGKETSRKVIKHYTDGRQPEVLK
jgi:hypothetical protein